MMARSTTAFNSSANMAFTDKELFAEVMRIRNKKHCRICGKAFAPKSKNQRYCTECVKVAKEKTSQICSILLENF